MDFLLLALYNVGAVAVAIAGLILERRGRPRLGIGLLFLSFFLILNLAVGGALLFVFVIVALYGALLGLPAFGIWYLVRRRRRGRDAAP